MAVSTPDIVLTKFTTANKAPERFLACNTISKTLSFISCNLVVILIGTPIPGGTA